MKEFAPTLLVWYAEECRDLPWRRTRDPYAILVSEVMLQQTRAQTVEGYFVRFLREFPTPEALAAASTEQVLKAWQGLGYYTRARNLHRAAQMISREYSGSFPQTVEALRRLPGVGGYTGAAVAAIAFGVPVAAVDGNVLRVMARVLDDPADISLQKTKKSFEAQLQMWVPAKNPGDFTQAMMELGAMICTPKNPQCAQCPVTNLCQAKQRGSVARRPVKSPKAKPKTLELYVVIIKTPQGIALRKRPETGMLAGMWEFVNFAKKTAESANEIKEKPPNASEAGESVSRINDAKGSAVTQNAEGESVTSQNADGERVASQPIAAALADLGIGGQLIAELGTTRHVFTHQIWNMHGVVWQSRQTEWPPEFRVCTVGEMLALPTPMAMRHWVALAGGRSF